MHNQNRVRDAFTLIELLVTISIIAILAALSVAGIGRARMLSEKAACSSNLRQVGSGLLNFASEHDGRLPKAGGVIPYKGPGAEEPIGWTQQIEPYLGVDRKVFRCPDAGRRFRSNSTYSYFIGSHPAYAAAKAEGLTGDALFQAVVLQRVEQPSLTIMGGDIASDMFDAVDADKDDFTQSPAFSGNAIHGGGANILFYDGHVAQYKSFDPTVLSVRYQGPQMQGEEVKYPDS